MRRDTFLRSLAALAAATLVGGAFAQGPSIVMASTTSTEQSGLFAHLLPAFKAAPGTAVRVVALGTGQALAGSIAAGPLATKHVDFPGGLQTRLRGGNHGRGAGPGGGLRAATAASSPSIS